MSYKPLCSIKRNFRFKNCTFPFLLFDYFQTEYYVQFTFNIINRLSVKWLVPIICNLKIYIKVLYPLINQFRFHHLATFAIINAIEQSRLVDLSKIDSTINFTEIHVLGTEPGSCLSSTKNDNKVKDTTDFWTKYIP